jgi:EAL domain-containing protein (putative c-di-GMP-specific phosphodiesterase class I)
MELIRGMDKSAVKQVIVRNTLNMLRDLGVEPVCEGVETIGELEALSEYGVTLMQGYLFAKPGLAALPAPIWPGDEPALRSAV